MKKLLAAALAFALGCSDCFAEAFSPDTGCTLTTSLTCYWDMDEASGTRVDSKNGEDLTDNNTVGSTTGKVADAAQFVSVDSEFLSRADSANLSLGADTSFTVACWVYIDTIQDSKIVDKEDAAVGTLATEYILGLNGDSTWRARIANGISSTTIDSDTGTAINTATWYFLVMIHDASADTFTLRVNDSTETQNSYSSGTQDGVNRLLIGARNVAGLDDQYFDGRIDEVGFWKKALTAQEVTDLYNAGTGNTYDPSGSCGGQVIIVS